MVECRHSHIVEFGLTFLAQSAVPLHYWTYAFFSSIFLINRLPSSSIGNRSPNVLLFKSKPDYSFIGVFGYLCFPRLRSFKTHKLSFLYEPCVFLRYCSKHHGYKCMSSYGCVYVSRNVVFHENAFPFVDSW